MRMFDKSSKLNDVCYDIRGPVMDEANRMEANGVDIIKLNIARYRCRKFRTVNVRGMNGIFLIKTHCITS